MVELDAVKCPRACARTDCVVAATLAVLLLQRRAPAPPPVGDPPQLSYVTTAHQLGVVGYRDPFGAISPDGTRLAYAEGRFIRVVPIGGGAPVTLAPGEGQIRYLTWKGNAEIVAEDVTPSGRWWSYRIGDADRKPLWDRTVAGELRQLTWSADGQSAAAVIVSKAGPELWRMAADGATPQRTPLTGRVSSPAFRPNGEVACIVNARLAIPCGGAVTTLDPDRDVHGPIAFAPNGNTVYFASPNNSGMVELWSADVATGNARRLSSFSRDTYAPSVASDGTVIFKVQTYRTHVGRRRFRRRHDPPTDDVPVRNAFVSSNPPADRLYLRHVAARDRRCEVSRHRAGDRRRSTSVNRCPPPSRPRCSRTQIRKIRRCRGRRTATGSRSTPTARCPTMCGCGRWTRSAAR